MDFSNMTVQEIIKKTRHKAELPLRVIAIIFTILVYVFVGLFGVALRLSPETYDMIIALADGDEMTLQLIELCKLIGFGLMIVLFVIMLILVIYGMYKQYAKEMSYAVRVSEKNFPEIYEKSKEFAEKLGMKKVPDVYICQENGVLNAFATMVPFRRYVQLNSELVDIAYMENKDLDVVYFTMAHEFGHIYLRHITPWYGVFTMWFRIIPIIGKILSRAMEYSCDRVGQALTDDKGAIPMMLACSAGRHLYSYVDKDDYIEKALGKYNFLERFSRFLTNLMTDHPIAPFRIKALLDPERKSGRLI